MPNTESDIIQAVTTWFTGMHLHHPSDPAGTLLVLPYGGADGRTENMGRSKTAMKYQGRQYPVMDVGTSREHNIEAVSSVGFEDPDHYLKLDNLKLMADASETIMYRDGRRRGVYGSLRDLSFTDIDLTTEISFVVERVDYSEEVL